MNYTVYNDELYHHGILGMKWGIRRYQNKDGSLTSAGKKRAAKLEEEYQKTTGRNIKEALSLHKSVKDMSDEELKNYVNRLNNERMALQYEKDISSLQPQKINKGKEFASNVWKSAVSPALMNVGKQYLEKTLKDKMGLNPDKTKSELDKLKEEYLKKNYRNQINKLDQEFKKAKEEATKKTEYEAKVEDKKSSSKEEWSKTESPNIYNVDWKNVTDSTVSSGRNYVDSYTALPSKIKKRKR